MSAVSRPDTSCTRSVPLRCAGEVICAFQPCSGQRLMISSESVAMMTSASNREERTASYTTPINGLPAISRSILRGRRVEARRAGITAIAFIWLLGSSPVIAIPSPDNARNAGGVAEVYLGWHCLTYYPAALRIKSWMYAPGNVPRDDCRTAFL